MKYLENNEIKNNVIDELIEQLYNYENQTYLGCDLGYQLLEGYNIDGVYFYNNYKANEYIKEHFEDLGEIVEEIKFQLGSEFIPNIFDEPDKFIVVIYLEVASHLMSQCEFIDTNWNNTIDLTTKNIEIIKNQLEKLRD